MFCYKITILVIFFLVVFEGYNEEFHMLEKKVEQVAKQRIEEDKKDAACDNKIRQSDVVAVFVPDWHKYIRATVKKKESDDSYAVWAIDYGVPMMVNASNIVNLPKSFTGMQLKSKRIHLGGLENCLPAEKRFDLNVDSSVKEKQLNWSREAIELVQKVLNQAIKLEFEHVTELEPNKKPHFFGRLMMQRLCDGEMVNVVKCLLEMNMAVLAEGEFRSLKPTI